MNLKVSFPSRLTITVSTVASHNFLLTVHAGEIIENSILINELTPSKEEADASYVLIGAAEDTDGNMYVVRSVINRHSNELSTMDVLYAMNAKKGTAALNAPLVSTPNYRTTISIAELLEYVNRYFPDVLPESVLRHFGHTSRPEGVIGESALYSEETDEVSARDMLISDMEAVAETDEEKSFIEKLKAEVEKANALQEELDEVNRKIKEASFTKGADRSVLPSLKEQKAQLVKKLNRLDSKFYGYRGYDTFKTLAERKSKDAVIAERLRGKEALRSQQQKYEEAAQSIKDTLAQREENRRRREIMRDIAKRIDKLDKLAKEDSKTKHIPSALRDIVKTFRETEFELFTRFLNEPRFDFIRNEEEFASLLKPTDK